jgi:adenylate kinase
MKKEFIFLGPPASGKGTQTKLLQKELNLPHVDTGSMLRAAIANGSEAGKIAKGYMDKGDLVPVEIVAKIIKERLSEDDCKNGFILDGYPRSVEQAKILDDIFTELNKGQEVSISVVNVDVSDEFLLERIVNRRFCKECGQIYSLTFTPPKEAGKCDNCKAELIQRSDDTEEVAKNRFKTYKEQTQPLIEFYTQKGWLHAINGEQSIDAVFADIKKAIG